MQRGDIIFNSHNSMYRQPFGAIQCQEYVFFRIQVSITFEIQSVDLCLWGKKLAKKAIPMDFLSEEDGFKNYTINFQAPYEPGIVWYYFELMIAGIKYYLGNNEDCLGGTGKVYEKLPLPFQITVYKKGAQTPDWFKDVVVYQIFVDRFYNGCEEGRFLNPKPKSLLHGCWEDTPIYIRNNDQSIRRWDFFGGNLLGVIKKLPYLKDLGIGAIYFNPIFEASSNHKYDTADYKNIDSSFGDNELFQELCLKAKDLGIYIILDGVFSHTGSDSIYFNKAGTYPGVGAFQDKSSAYFSWYKFKSFPQEYECWWDIEALPNLNELEPSYLDFIIKSQDSVLRYWMNLGVKGWRLDVADELPGQFISSMRTVMKELDPDSVLIGEVWEDASNKISYGELREYFLGDELDGVMNYPFRKILLGYILGHFSVEETASRLISLYENYPSHNFYSNLNLLGSHDVPRVLTLLGEAKPEGELNDIEKENYFLSKDQRTLAINRLKLLALIQMTFPGVPCIYYGDEVGMEGFSDPFNRGPYPWGSEDKDLFDWYKKVIALRNNHPVFKKGLWQIIYNQQDVLGFVRSHQEQLAVCFFNRNKTYEQKVVIDLHPWEINQLKDWMTSESIKTSKTKELIVKLAPLEGKIFFT